MISTSVWGVMNSNDDDITKIYDSSGNACGFGKTTDYPILFLQTFSKPYKSVCVKKCPKFDYNAIKFNKDPNENPETSPDK